MRSFSVWETINNTGFKPIEFDGFRTRAGRSLLGLPAVKRLGTRDQGKIHGRTGSSRDFGYTVPKIAARSCGQVQERRNSRDTVPQNSHQWCEKHKSATIGCINSSRQAFV